MGSLPSDGGHAHQGDHEDEGEGHGHIEQRRGLPGELGHTWDEEEPNEAHSDGELDSEDGVHLRNGFKRLSSEKGRFLKGCPQKRGLC